MEKIDEDVVHEICNSDVVARVLSLKQSKGIFVILFVSGDHLKERDRERFERDRKNFVSMVV